MSEWSEFFDDAEPEGDTVPSREDSERALMLCSLAGTPDRARRLLGLGSKRTLFRICRGDRVHASTLRAFTARIEAAERVGEILRRRHWQKICGLEVSPLAVDELAMLRSALDENEVTQLEQKFGVQPLMSPREPTFKEIFLAKVNAAKAAKAAKLAAAPKKQGPQW